MLSSWEILSQEQAIKATQQLWSRRGINGLPDLANLNAIGYVLRFSPVPNIDAATVVKNYILSIKPTTATKDSDGKRVLTVAVAGIWCQQFIHECVVVSRELVSFHGEPLTGIEWTADEANALYDKALAWWEVDKAVIQTEEQRNHPSLLGGNPVFSEARRLDDFFRLVVLPYAHWNEITAWPRFFEWLSELRSLGLYMASCYPYILLQQPNEAGRFATELLLDLNSNLEDAVAAAAESIRYWSHLAKTRRIPALDPRLIEAFVQRIALRRVERIEYCLNIFSHLIEERPELFSLDQISLLVVSLDPWNQSTLLTTGPISQDGFPPAKRPKLRSRLGELTGALKRWLVKMAPTVCIPEQIVSWELSCAKDPLPEVRRSFNDWDNIARPQSASSSPASRLTQVQDTTAKSP